MASFVEQDSNPDAAAAQVITQMEGPDTETISTLSPRRRSSRHSPQRPTSFTDIPQLWMELYQASYTRNDDTSFFKFVPQTPNSTVFQSVHPPINAAYDLRSTILTGKSHIPAVLHHQPRLYQECTANVHRSRNMRKFTNLAQNLPASMAPLPSSCKW